MDIEINEVQCVENEVDHGELGEFAICLSVPMSYL